MWGWGKKRKGTDAVVVSLSTHRCWLDPIKNSDKQQTSMPILYIGILYNN
ncbi:hypothetical protein EAJ10_16180 [Bacteroides thetaiotaomicron]|uniref:Uncharacterized protein n=2 Tax=Bacteroides thetaiotaomicron TaxID=818 RepID=Q8A4T2_BACTN|nr:hypothetical protein BT_2515 [Bacteroides thetaiotaomicron VPI-5482]KAA0088556.1 hypothetical protein FIB20_21215 [Bacteroides thetaiotaomicron]RGC84082.1 hypothetical protein DW640_16125 [Bacteroides sp. AM23-12]KAA0100281.1 hypothetical protein FIA61_22375 [Bacteroides thetaiotaomicron]KAB4418542.1 hypothetical protein GAN94_17080 [Bacteroides thetaiotaomicron]